MKKIFIPILAATVLMGGVLAFAIWKAAPATSKDFLNSGKKYFAQKRFSEAAVQFMNAIQKDPRNRDARYLLALSYSNEQNLSLAAQQLNSLLEYFPDDVEANLRLGNIYLAAGRSDKKYFDQASDIAKKVLAKDPRNVGALILSGNAAAGLQDYASSVDLYEKALSLDPQNLAAFVSLGTSEVMAKNFPEAEQAFLKARQVNPKDKSALISLANYYRAARQPEKAEAVFTEGLSMYPTDRDIYIQAADFYNKNGQFDQAEKVLQTVQANAPKDPTPSMVLIELYISKDRPEDARKLLLDLKAKFPKDPNIAAKVALSFLQDQPDRAKVEIDQILKTDPKSVVGNVLLGEYEFLRAQYDAAEATLSKQPAIDSPFPQPHFFLGNIAMKKGLVDQALFHYQKALEINSAYLPARVALAEVFMNKGNLANSRNELQKALDVRPDYVPAQILKATIDGTDKSNPNAEKELTGLVKAQPQNAIVYRQMGLYYDSRGRTADAEKDLERATELSPDSQQMLRDLILFYIRQKEGDRALAKLNSIPDDKKQAFHYELIGLVYSQTGKPDQAEAAFKKALDKDATRTSSDVLLMSQYLRDGKVNDGLAKLDDMIRKNPTNGSPYAIKGTIFENEGKLPEAEQNYAEALKLNPDIELAENNYAYLLAEQGQNLETALTWAQMARQKQPENPSMADTLGWVYYKLGNYGLARDQEKFALSKQPDNGSFLYHMGVIYKANKQIAEAETALKKAANSPTAFKEKSLAQAALAELSKGR